ncbi:hypothetical protein GNI_111380 [Gregarina niphandrodes]|uniref:Importin N-terminal domain-containing protein n=1 Tax=Gregarina niphandrodes TaxID=110365 RepID=A0A023B3I6_GRENI|nr:hypothetical protein GNI_111380 [Gregarina niphandrodes]EZG55528.1 hypothetical protein GNI_111380 [Gregarina niphandrodes]|eukprot:XP_011131514.1 hypothetical protein GNI_111380 [Gregarina niphandrodes]
MDVATLSQLCSSYCSADPRQQMDAYKALLPYLDRPETCVPLMQCLKAEQNPLVISFIATALRQIIVNQWPQIDTKLREELRTALLGYLQRSGLRFAVTNPEQIAAVIIVYVKLTYLQWTNNPEQQKVADELSPLLQSNTESWILAMNIYSEVIQQWEGTSSRIIGKQLRTNVLPPVLKSALDMLLKFMDGTLAIQDTKESLELVKSTLTFIRNALSFSSTGSGLSISNETFVLNSSESVTGAKELQCGKIFIAMYQIFCKLSSAHARDCKILCLQCLCASMNSLPRKQTQLCIYAQELIEFVLNVISNNLGFDQTVGRLDQTFTEFTIFLSQMASAITLNTIKTAMSVKDMPELYWSHLQDAECVEFISTLCTFTLNTIKQKGAMNATHHLLKFWAKLFTNSCSGKTACEFQPVHHCVFNVYSAFVEYCMQLGEITSCLAIWNKLEESGWFQSGGPRCLLFDLNKIQDLSENVEGDPLTDETLREELLDLLTQLGTAMVPDAVAIISSAWDQCLALSAGNTSVPFPEDLLVKRFAWLIYIAGAILQSYFQSPVSISAMEFKTSDADSVGRESVVGPLTQRVFGYMAEPRTNISAELAEPLSLAELQFLQIYVKTSTNVCDETVLNVVCDNLVHNLVFKDGTVLKRTVDVLATYTEGFSIQLHSPSLYIGKALVKTNAIKQLIEPNSFRSIAGRMPTAKLRRKLYCTVTQLFLYGLADVDDPYGKRISDANNIFDLPSQTAFKTFLAPFEEAETQEGGPAAALELCCDFRGICEGCRTGDAYVAFMSWLVNRPSTPARCRMNMFYTVLEKHANNLEVSLTCLKFMTECIVNRRDRLYAQNSQVRDLGMVVIPGHVRALWQYIQSWKDDAIAGVGAPHGVGQDVVYKTRYRVLKTIVELVNGLLQWLDLKAFMTTEIAVVIKWCVRMVLSIPPHEFRAYIRKFTPMITFVEKVVSSSMNVYDITPDVFSQLVVRLQEGILSSDNAAQVAANDALNSLARYAVSRAAISQGIPVAVNLKSDLPQNEEQAEEWVAAGRVFSEWYQGPNVTDVLRTLFTLLQANIYSDRDSLSCLHPLLTLLRQKSQEVRDNLVAQEIDLQRRQRLGEVLEALFLCKPDLSESSYEERCAVLDRLSAI